MSEDTHEVGPKTLIHPKDIMDAKTQHWERLWSPQAGDEFQQVSELFVDIRQRIQGESLMPRKVQELREAPKSMRPNAAMGVDRVGSHAFDRLPDAAIAELGEILTLCELHQ
eukprot:2038197-Pyramimonas_sp.AAC.1